MRESSPPWVKDQQANDSGGKTAASSWLALIILCLAQFVVVLDVQIVVIALPTIQHAFGLSQTSLQWVVNGYVLLFGGLLMFALTSLGVVSSSS